MVQICPDDGDVVQHQYRRWPFPPWSRVGAVRPTPVEQLYRDLGVVLSRPPGATLKILVAGCGTGKEVATLQGQFPEARITAVDFSETSLAYASKRCDRSATDFHLLDIRRVGELGEKFDLIFCSGVLHHLDDPVEGWEALIDVLKDGGLMRIMLYSEAGRFPLKVARSRIPDLRDGPMDADRLRAIRKRFLETGAGLICGYVDFFTLPGVYDLLVHSREHCFTVDSIQATLDGLDLKLAKFELPSPAFEAGYRTFNPSDGRQRDYSGWRAFEEANPYLFRSMYVFWCGKRHGLRLI
jgi:SAM-dependent methyltransferase